MAPRIVTPKANVKPSLANTHINTVREIIQEDVPQSLDRLSEEEKINLKNHIEYFIAKIQNMVARGKIIRFNCQELIPHCEQLVEDVDKIFRRTHPNIKGQENVRLLNDERRLLVDLKNFAVHAQNEINDAHQNTLIADRERQ